MNSEVLVKKIPNSKQFMQDAMVSDAALAN